MNKERERVMSTLDFDKIQRIMTAENWTWMGEAPSVQQLKDTLNDMIDQAFDSMKSGSNNWCIHQTGGFTVFAGRLKTGVVTLEVTFGPSSF